MSPARRSRREAAAGDGPPFGEKTVEVVLRPSRSEGPSLGVLALSFALVPSRRRLQPWPRKALSQEQMKHFVYQQYSCNSNKFAINVYQAECMSISRLMRSSRRKHETGIASLAISNQKMFLPKLEAIVNSAAKVFPRRRISMTDVIVKEPEAQAKFLRCRLPHGRRAAYSSTANSIGDDGHSHVYSLPFPWSALHSWHLRVRALTNSIVSCSSGWSLSPPSPWVTYLTTPLRQLSCRVAERR